MAERRTAHALLEQDGHGLHSPSAGLRSAQGVRAPRAQAFEAELKKYMAVEQAVAAMPSVQALGPLTLETLPLRSSLRAEAASWKAQFARNLHRQGADELKARPAAARGAAPAACASGGNPNLNLTLNLRVAREAGVRAQAFEAYVRDTKQKLARQVEDLEDVRYVMAVLKEVRVQPVAARWPLGLPSPCRAVAAPTEMRRLPGGMPCAGMLSIAWPLRCIVAWPSSKEAHTVPVIVAHVGCVLSGHRMQQHGVRPRAQVREREAGIDQLLAPIKDMYALLVRYEVRRRCLTHRVRVATWPLPGYART